MLCRECGKEIQNETEVCSDCESRKNSGKPTPLSEIEPIEPLPEEEAKSESHDRAGLFDPDNEVMLIPNFVGTPPVFMTSNPMAAFMMGTDKNEENNDDELRR